MKKFYRAFLAQFYLSGAGGQIGAERAGLERAGGGR